jgi:hypothetical protein
MTNAVTLKARETMIAALAADPFISVKHMTDEAMTAIDGTDLDRRWLDDMAFELSETIETCF